MAKSLKRSALSSACTVSVEIAIFATCSLVVAGPALVAARWIVGASGSVANYVLNRRWAFANRGVRKREQGLRFALVSFCAVSLATGLYWAATHFGQVDPRLAHVGSMATVWLCFTFPLMKRWVFAENPDRATGASVGLATCCTPRSRPAHRLS